MEQKTAQLRVKPKAIIAEGSGGTVFWATPTRARLLIASGAAEFVGTAGPAETKPAGPGETKESAEKKFLDGAQAGQSTASALSSAPATVAPSSVSPEAPVSPLNNARRSRRGGKSTDGAE